jgi:MerR family transcriptional regulator, redox-sensitive transcriptional activator SoxR
VNDATLTIGEVARLVGVNASAIRYYESIGVLPEPERDHGQRRYTRETIWRLQVIDIAKRAGFSLDDARQLLETENGGLLAHEQPHDLAERDSTAPELGNTHGGLSRIDDRGLENLVVTQRHHLRAVILTAVQLSNERHRR